MPKFESMNTPERLKYLRVERDNNSTQHDLYFKLLGMAHKIKESKALDYPKQTIYRLEKGLTELPPEFALAYSKYFNVSLDFLYCNTDYINVGYDEVKEKLGLSDFALNKLVHIKKNEQEKKALSVLDCLLSSANSNNLIDLLNAIYSHRDIAIKNIVSQYSGNVFVNSQYIKKPIILENGDLEYISLFKVSEIAKEIANFYKKSGGK